LLLIFVVPMIKESLNNSEPRGPLLLGLPKPSSFICFHLIFIFKSSFIDLLLSTSHFFSVPITLVKLQKIIIRIRQILRNLV
jgi:hypothetical protein